MRISYQTAWLQKNGCAPDEYEDSFAPENAPVEPVQQFRCAVADGATETSFSGLWAKILCQSYVTGETSLETMQAQWLSQVSSKNLPWYAEQKLESGAFAALVCLEIRQEDERITWSAKAIGDSCLFHLRDGKLLNSFPIEDWKEFNNSPLLMASRADRNEEALAGLREITGACIAGDQFLLMTDAISNWFLRKVKEGDEVTDEVESFAIQEKLTAICSRERVLKLDDGRAAMPNDDVTVALISVTA
ncbi:MAG: protein phosphatase 2C domain-containing protein [Candidatus Obscuribacterales bacterium]|nr:protein phosphatase 2C domain-containing protein [Candidatus Obscuribacterales bacterium]